MTAIPVTDKTIHTPSLKRGRGRPRKLKTLPSQLPDLDRIVKRYAHSSVQRSIGFDDRCRDVTGAQALYHDVHRTYLMYYTPDMSASMLLQQYGKAFLFAQEQSRIRKRHITCIQFGLMKEPDKYVDECELVFDESHIFRGHALLTCLTST